MDDRSGQQFFIVGNVRLIALRRSRLTQNTAGMTFRDTILLPNLLYAPTAAIGAYQFPLSGLFEDQLVHCQFCHRSLEASVLLFQILQPSRLVDL